jgi:hypothetical protein
MAELVTAGVETIERREDIYKDARSVVSYWLNCIKLSEKQEDGWRRQADNAVKIYRAEINPAFNILHSNVETIVPALFNSTPVADVRTRHGDKNELARRGAQVLERGLAFQLDEYDFDQTITASVRDMQLAGRGIDRIRYRPYTRTDTVKGPTGEDIPQESVVWEEATCEHVSWRGFRRGNGSMWSDINWVAFELVLNRDELIELAGEEVGKRVGLDATELAAGELSSEREKSAFKRAKVWEIWDKTAREVLFIAPSFAEKPLAVVPDPLGLLDFFPCPCPLQAISDPDTMVPVVPYEIYRKQAEELADVSSRILGLIGVMKFRGFRASEIPDFEALENLEDGEFAPTSQALALIGGGKALDDAIWVVPLDKLVATLRELVQQREVIKAAIFEITGIADIMRGASNPNETLGAQQIKTQWGSLRVQHQQREVQRYCRDLFRMKAEIIANKFSVDTLQAIAGEPFDTMVPVPAPQPRQGVGMPGMGVGGPEGMPAPQAPPQPPAMVRDEAQSGENHPVIKLLRNDIRRTYLIDIETDSTIRGDLVRNQQNMTQFLQGTAQFFGSLVPLIQSGTFPPELIGASITIFDAFGRQFKLGKQVEDKLGELTKAAEEQASQPPEKKPDPRAEAEKAKLEMEKERLVIDKQDREERRKMDQDDMVARLDMDRAKNDQELNFRRQDLALKTAAQNKQIMAEASEELTGEGAAPELGAATPLEKVLESIQQLAGTVAMAQAQQGQQFNQLAQMIAAPKRVIRDPRTGRAEGVETVSLN